MQESIRVLVANLPTLMGGTIAATFSDQSRHSECREVTGNGAMPWQAKDMKRDWLR
jgi:hypothetical protein